MSLTPEPTSLPAAPDPRTASSEPLLTVGAVTALVVAVVALLVSLGLHISDAQQAGILAVVAAVAPIITAVWGRAKVYSPRTVVRLLADARSSRPPSTF